MTKTNYSTVLNLGKAGEKIIYGVRSACAGRTCHYPNYFLLVKMLYLMPTE